MRIRLTFKSPDAVSEAIDDAGFTRRENPDEYADLCSELAEFIRNGEYLVVEYDTETKQMVILPK